MVGKGRAEGTYTITKGTGKLDGIRRMGTWVSTAVAQGQNYTDEEWEMELPGR